MPAGGPPTPDPERLAGLRAAAVVAGATSAAGVLARLRTLLQVGERRDDIAVVSARLP